MPAAGAPYLQIIGSAGEITKKEKPKKTIVYPTVYEEYRTHWGIKEAIREFIANAIDATQGYPDKYEISILKDHDRKYLVIANAGAGMNYIDFYLGGSSAGKAGQHTIGRFHEGMKVASWVLLKKDVNPETPPVMIFWKEKDTGSYHLTVWKSREDPEIGGKLPYLVDYEVPEDVRTLLEQTGKSVVVIIDLSDVDTDGEVTAEMLNDIYIPADHPGIKFVLNPEEAPIKQFWIIETSSEPFEHNSIYVGGIKIASVGKIAGKASVFSYNFPPGNLKTLEESRRSMQYSELLEVLGGKYLEIKAPEIWRSLFRAIEKWHEDASHGSLLEEEIDLRRIYFSGDYTPSRCRATFKAIAEALKDVYGKNVVLISPEHAKEGISLQMVVEILEYHGYTVLPFTSELFQSLARFAERGYLVGIKSTKQAIEDLKKVSYSIIPEDRLSEFSRKILQGARSYAAASKYVLEWLMSRNLLGKGIAKLFEKGKSWDVKDVYVVEFNDTYRKIEKETSTKSLGFYDTERKIIGLNLDYIRDLEQKVKNGEITEEEAYIQVLETMTEEVIHAVTGYTDLEERNLFLAAKFLAAYFFLNSENSSKTIEKLGKLEEVLKKKGPMAAKYEGLKENFEENKRGYYWLLYEAMKGVEKCEKYQKPSTGLVGKVKRAIAKLLRRVPTEEYCNAAKQAYELLTTYKETVESYGA